jgi:hypothetical protein
VADAGACAIRAVHLRDRTVRTIAGAWDGRCFQYPLAVQHAGGRLLVADTLGNRLCAVEATTGAVAGIDLAMELAEPAALTLHRDRLVLAERAGHAIREVELASPEAARPLLA